MFGLTGTLKYYLCDGFTDMRCGIDGLSKLVRTKMRQDPTNGDVFIFISKSRRLIKLLRYESDAYILYEKRLDRHRFMRPVYDEQKRCYRMNWERFVLLLQGIVRKELLIAS